MTYEFAESLNAHLAAILAQIGFHYQGQNIEEKKDGSLKASIVLVPGVAIRTYRPMGKGFHTNYEAVIQNIKAAHVEKAQARGKEGAA